MPKIPKPNRPKTIGIVGSRRRDTDVDFRICRNQFLAIYEVGDQIVSGGCPHGADRFADILARAMGITITIHYANWNGPDDKKAGFVRNSLIAQDCDVLIALVAPDRTGGTEDTIRKAIALGKEVILV